MAHVTAVSPLAQIAGGETGLLRLLPALAERGWHVSLTVPASGRLSERARAARIPVRRLPLGPPERRAAGSYLGAAMAPVALRNADVVLLNGLSTQRVAPALGLVGTPAVLRVNNPLLAPPSAWGRRSHWRRVRAIAADSDHVAAECRAAGAPPELVHTAYPAAWEGREPPGASAGPPGENGLRVLFVGQLEARKGVSELLEAARTFLAQRHDASLSIVGEPAPGSGEYATRLREAVAGDPALGARVRFEGWVDDASGAMTASDLVVVPSLAEPFGTVAAEAAAAGRPVVASAVGGLPEVVIESETGLLVPPGDPGALAQAVSSLLGDPGRLRALGANALERAERFSPSAYAARIEQLLHTAIGARS